MSVINSISFNDDECGNEIRQESQSMISKEKKPYQQSLVSTGVVARHKVLAKPDICATPHAMLCRSNGQKIIYCVGCIDHIVARTTTSLSLPPFSLSRTLFSLTPGSAGLEKSCCGGVSKLSLLLVAVHWLEKEI
jgi:hypothetical protein